MTRATNTRTHALTRRGYLKELLREYQLAGQEYHETIAKHPQSADICYPAMDKMRKAMDKYYGALAEIREREGVWGARK